MTISGFKGIAFDGIMGLSYPNISLSGAISIIDELKNQGAISEKIFAFYLSKSEMDNPFLQIICKMLSGAHKL